MKKSLLLLLVAFATLVASAQTKVEIDGIWYNLVPKVKQAEVTFKGDSYDSYHDEYSGSITLPATVTHNGVAYSVTKIGRNAFSSCSGLTAITIPEGVTRIEYYAFSGCSSLTSITIPKSVTSIGDWAFEGCSSIAAVHISSIEAWCKISFGRNSYDSNPLRYAHNLYLNGELITELVVPEGVTSIGEMAFCACSSLTAITLPMSVTSIGYYAFEGCSNLTTITIPESSQLTSIGNLAFAYCSSLTAITIPEGVTSIGSEAFYNCSNLTAITIPESSQLTNIAGWAFRDCSSLTAITIPKGVTRIEESAFSGCNRLTTITIPEGVTSIGGWAFHDCSSLVAITIPESVTSIGNYAFESCCFTTIVLPKSVRSIGSGAFAYCTQLHDVYCYAKTVPSTSTDAFKGPYMKYVTLHVPTSALASYKAKSPWSNFGKFETMSIAVERITLSQSSATLTEGEDLTLTATVEPNDAEDLSITWSSSSPSVATVDNTGKVTAIAPGTATITATANDGSGVSASCEVTVNELILGKCATPTISYEDGKVVFACDTEGATIKSNVKENIAGDYNEIEFDFIPTYTLTAYATKEKYEDSDEVTLTLCWVPCDENHEGGTTDILTIPAKPVLISTQGGVITVSGLAESTAVAAYTTAGTELATATATNGTATLTATLTAGSIAIVKIGNYSIKVAIK